ncbi:MAG: hypothetical protein ACI3YB_00470 [Prevotella sp.]
MKRILSLAVFGLSVCNGLHAAIENSGDTLVIEQPQRVVVENDGKQMRMIVEGNKNSPDYRYVYSHPLDSMGLSVVREQEHDDAFFSVSFSRYIKIKNRNKMFKGHWNGFGFGFGSVVQGGTGGLNGPEGVSVNMSDSHELFWNITSYSRALGCRGFGLVTGIGIDWRNFRMDGDYRFVKDGSKVAVSTYNEGETPKFSRLKVFSITVPLLLEWQLSDNGFFVNAGPVMNINTYASLKTRYKTPEGKKRKEINKGVHQVPVTVDFMGQMGYGIFGAYIKYSPFHLLQTDYAPEMCPLTCGLILQF